MEVWVKDVLSGKITFKPDFENDKYGYCKKYWDSMNIYRFLEKIPEYLLKNNIKYKNEFVYWTDDNNKYHSDDSPAIIYEDGSMKWYKHGLKHNDNNEPSYIDMAGEIHYCKNNEFHNDNDEPSFINGDGSQSFEKNGIKKRDNDMPHGIFIDECESDFHIEYDDRIIYFDNHEDIEKYLFYPVHVPVFRLKFID